MKQWTQLRTPSPSSGALACSQRHWDQITVSNAKRRLWDGHHDPRDRATLLITSAIHSGDWLHALSITSCGLRLENEAVRLAVGFRLGVPTCEPLIVPVAPWWMHWVYTAFHANAVPDTWHATRSSTIWCGVR